MKRYRLAVLFCSFSTLLAQAQNAPIFFCGANVTPRFDSNPPRSITLYKNGAIAQNNARVPEYSVASSYAPALMQSDFDLFMKEWNTLKNDPQQRFHTTPIVAFYDEGRRLHVRFATANDSAAAKVWIDSLGGELGKLMRSRAKALNGKLAGLCGNAPAPEYRPETGEVHFTIPGRPVDN
jgi:hypothetical protein